MRVFPDFPPFASLYFPDMVLHRARITRIIAAILTLALSTQVAEAQVVNCIIMSATQANHDHGGLTQHQHHASDAGTAATRSGDSHSQSSGTAGCSQSILCANAPAIPTTAMRTIHFDNAEPLISPGASVLEARALHPDPPPPRI
jgi:hypothetical protein